MNEQTVGAHVQRSHSAATPPAFTVTVAGSPDGFNARVADEARAVG